jgi:hypothetical protein
MTHNQWVVNWSGATFYYGNDGCKVGPTPTLGIVGFQVFQSACFAFGSTNGSLPLSNFLRR